MELTKRQKWFYDFLNEHDDWYSPTELGYAYGIWKSEQMGRDSVPLSYHSAAASPVCLQLVKLGLIQRNNAGHYKRIDE